MEEKKGRRNRRNERTFQVSLAGGACHRTALTYGSNSYVTGISRVDAEPQEQSPVVLPMSAWAAPLTPAPPPVIWRQRVS